MLKSDSIFARVAIQHLKSTFVSDEVGLKNHYFYNWCVKERLQMVKQLRLLCLSCWLCDEGRGDVTWFVTLAGLLERARTFYACYKKGICF